MRGVVPSLACCFPSQRLQKLLAPSLTHDAIDVGSSASASASASAGPISIRTVEIDGAPWFVGQDVAYCLGLNVHAGAGTYTRGISADEKCVVPRSNIDPIHVWPTHGLTVVSESGLYKVVMRSDKPEARKFQDWVTRDVLPAIRKDGGYMVCNRGRRMDALRDSLQRPRHRPPPM
ncbi:BRO-N domain-containing protein [Azospirillum ramasamyi]|uniref:Bro-N domain-containing protein n=1 Tax=Azospirillum ramasamyi TaxID=682998 RepID=A0A2U9S5V3_9PROT|nr:hypothetical protein DM194_06075 [Azospirillum ramasamyi]